MSNSALRVDRYPDGKIPAPRRYVDYDGQVIVRTRFSTHQRWKKAGSHVGRRSVAPYILHSSDCSGDSGVLEPYNDELEESQFSVYYVDDGETVLYEVSNDE